MADEIDTYYLALIEIYPNYALDPYCYFSEAEGWWVGCPTSIPAAMQDLLKL